MNKGFTIVELIVVISIISILSTIMLVDYGRGRTVIKKQQSVQTFVQAVRSAQNKALGGEVVNCTDSPCKYGVYVEDDSPTVLIFGDGTNGFTSNNAYDAGEEIIETYNMEEGILVARINPGGGPKMNILFEPPDPTVSFNPCGGCANINFEINDSPTNPDSIVVIVTNGGSVDIQ